MTAEMENALLDSAMNVFDKAYYAELEHERDMFDETCETLDY